MSAFESSYPRATEPAAPKHVFRRFADEAAELARTTQLDEDTSEIKENNFDGATGCYSWF